VSHSLNDECILFLLLLVSQAAKINGQKEQPSYKFIVCCLTTLCYVRCYQLVYQQLFAVAATLKSIDYNVAMTFILNNN